MTDEEKQIEEERGWYAEQKVGLYERVNNWIEWIKMMIFG